MISIHLLVYLTDNSWKETIEVLVSQGDNQQLLYSRLRFT